VRASLLVVPALAGAAGSALPGVGDGGAARGGPRATPLLRGPRRGAGAPPPRTALLGLRRMSVVALLRSVASRCGRRGPQADRARAKCGKRARWGPSAQRRGF
jgi:hypothetical protein